MAEIPYRPAPTRAPRRGWATPIAETHAVFMAGRLPTDRIGVLNENDNYGSPDERGSTGVSIDQWRPRLTWVGVCPMNRLSDRVRWASTAFSARAICVIVLRVRPVARATRR